MQQLNDSLLKKLHEVFTSAKYKLSHSAIHLYGYYVFKLLDSDKPTLSISNKWITNDSGLSSTTIVKARKELVEVGLIKVKKVVDKQMGNLPLTVELIGVNHTQPKKLEQFDIVDERMKHFIKERDSKGGRGVRYEVITDEEIANTAELEKRLCPPSTNTNNSFNQYRPCDTPQVVTLPTEIKEFIGEKEE